jgi:hypothetical protein
VNQVSLRQAMAELVAGEPADAVDANRALARGKMARRARRLKVSAAGAVVVAALVAAVPVSRGFLVGDRAEPAGPHPKTAPYDDYPDSIAVIGHTTALGIGSNPADPTATVPANSWATGTNPAVNSLYQRILALHPGIKDHYVNLSDLKFTIDEAPTRAFGAAQRQPPPDLIVMQLLDYDVPCPADEGMVASYESSLVGALENIHQKAPYTRVFVVSQFGSPTTQIQALSLAQRRQLGAAAADFSCVIVDRNGQVIPENLKSFEDALHSYERALESACAQYELCASDNGAFGNIVEAPADLSADFNHLSVRGQARAAAVAWAALQRAGLVPPD